MNTLYKKETRKTDRRCKLSEEDIAMIRILVENNRVISGCNNHTPRLTYKQIGKMFGVSDITVMKYGNDESYRKMILHYKKYYREVLKDKQRQPNELAKLHKHQKIFRSRHKTKMNEYHRNLGKQMRYLCRQEKITVIK